MLFTEVFDTVEEAIDHYDQTRTRDNKALTIESQKRAVYHFKHFLERVCVDRTKGLDVGLERAPKKEYVKNSLKFYKRVQAELDKMEKCEEYMYTNALNIFSVTMGPFEK